MTTDVHYKKTIPFRYAGQSLEFRVSQQLFSSHQIDPGTRQLLQSLANHPAGAFERVLDLGCGYGPIGLCLVKAGIAKSAHLADRDALAVDYTLQNAALNAFDKVEAYGSLGYSDIPRRDFDLISMNVPGKAGESVVEALLLGARHFVADHGKVATVIVNALGDFAASVLERDPNVIIDQRGGRSGYALFEYHFDTTDEDSAPPDLDLYLRDEIDVQLEAVDYTLQVARGLPDFEAPGHPTQLLIDQLPAISDDCSHATVFNPGQGNVPVALALLAQPEQISLVDRDLLALRYSRRNLMANGFNADRVSTFHKPSIATGPSSHLIAGLLRGDESITEAQILARDLADQTLPGGYIVVAGGSTAVTRLETASKADKRLSIDSRKRRRGSSVLVMRRTAT